MPHGEAGPPLGPSKGMPPFTSDSLRRHGQRNDAAVERARHIFEALKAGQAKQGR